MFGDDALGAEFEAWLGDPGERAPALPHDPGRALMYLGTGGTTGAPKGIVDHRSPVLHDGPRLQRPHEGGGRPVYLMATPMTHAAGTVGFPTLAEGGTIVVHDGVAAERDPRLDRARPGDAGCSCRRPRSTRCSPTPACARRDYSSLRHFIYAAAPMSADKLVEAMDVFGPVMAQCFGQAEAPMICTFMSPAEHVEALADPAKRGRLASCGRPSMIAAVEIMDDDGKLLGDGEHGEIVVRGDLVMAGYYDDPEASAEVSRPGGWHAHRRHRLPRRRRLLLHRRPQARHDHHRRLQRLPQRGRAGDLVARATSWTAP